ncbi:MULTISPECIES: Asp23/Gls24 family envelope stress response protein [Enterococcus]|uniref:Asp23/Gls24 family envelope stress response protein n=1 Tax=Enterococcus TaxID=1350 RepID=UPI000EE74288|nr:MULTISPECIES: Asp23/Gls24 family envelope stress response protein [Enterococcus]HCM87765.1 Asp23/Gls24 family envelope stress response protein [Enterococcus sp.]
MENNYENKNVDEKTAVSGQVDLNNSGSIHSDNTSEVQGDVFYEDKVIQKIIGTAVEKIDGLLTVDGGFFSNLAEKMVNTENVTSGIEAEVGEKQVAVDMDVVIEYGQDITEIAAQIRKVIRDEVAKMTHLEVIEVNIHVVDIKTKAEFEEDSETVQDKVTSAAKTTGEFTSKQTDKAKDAIGRGADKAQEKIEDNQETRVN